MHLNPAWTGSWNDSWHGQDKLGSAVKPVLEINPRHDLVVALADLGDAEQTLREDPRHLLLDEARILDGELPADAKAFSQRLARSCTEAFQGLDWNDYRERAVCNRRASLGSVRPVCSTWQCSPTPLRRWECNNSLFATVGHFNSAPTQELR